MWGRTLIILINLVFLVLIGVGTAKQIETQKENNQVMAGVHDNIKKAKELTTETNEKLKPLRATADTIEEMNGKLVRTKTMLTGMNQNLAGVINSETKIVHGLDELNRNTTQVIQQLDGVKQKNAALLGPAKTVAKQTGTEYGTIERLYSLTGISIRELAEINNKFGWLNVNY
ncbi:hypothetical protein C8P63_1089 [Melghirimyces profundicolus]|uniref:Uncharacterized protein n=1 Tax=Melghirimyces profundicolus TaxID=1242148 RepID=A0A2T6BXA1_9BACL|nr:hypothetical protein [Melghirimyces profundicolus]PTX60700.1 hypothetical protein C8P63_1089 [Melghirimyces profundicolus]